jgi:XTP/dITP diphosphohydrolase
MEITAERGGPSGGLEILTLREIVGHMPDIDETGDSLEENAWIKAEGAISRLMAHDSEFMMDTIVIADDSGLFVDCLDGRPGVRSARYGVAAPHSDAPHNASPTPVGADVQSADTYASKINMLLSELSGVPQARRTASFRCAIAVRLPDGRKITAEGACSGEIGLAPMGENGFGYDPIFYIPLLGRTMAELTGREKNEHSHRGMAVRSMADRIDDYLNDGRSDR